MYNSHPFAVRHNGAAAAVAAALESKSSFPFLGGQSGCKVAR